MKNLIKRVLALIIIFGCLAGIGNAALAARHNKLIKSANLPPASTASSIKNTTETTSTDSSETTTSPLASTTAIPLGDNYVLSFEDDFNNNVLNLDNWKYRTSSSSYGGYNSKDNVSVVTDNGIGYLRIDYTLTDINFDNKADAVGGGVISLNSFGYGYYEANVKFYNNDVGFHQSFWTYGCIGYDSFEIDGIEMDSAINYSAADYHINDLASYGDNMTYKNMNYANWITVSFDWQPGLLIFYIDGVEQYRWSYSGNDNIPQHIYLTGLANTAAQWGGAGTPEVGACYMIDYVKYYKNTSF